MGKYKNAAEKQKAYRDRKRNAQKAKSNDFSDEPYSYAEQVAAIKDYYARNPDDKFVDDGRPRPGAVTWDYETARRDWDEACERHRARFRKVK